MKNDNEYNSEEGFSFTAINEIKDVERLSKNVQHLSSEELMSLKAKLISSIQEVSLQLGPLLQERYSLQEQVAGRHVTIEQLLRVQEARASQLGLQPAVQMSPAPVAAARDEAGAR